MTAQLSLCESCAAWIDSEIVPIWLILSRRPSQAFFSMAVLMRSGFVTGARGQLLGAGASCARACSPVRSSPMTVTPELARKYVHDSQSSWSKGSSMEVCARATSAACP